MSAVNTTMNIEPVITIAVHGMPVTQGSKMAYRSGTGANRVMMLDSNRVSLKPWRQTVSHAALAILPADWVPLEGPLSAELHFTFYRPKSHKGKRTWPIGKQDVDKLVRAVFDSLTDAGVWRDDGLVVSLRATKDYSDFQGVRITVGRVSEVLDIVAEE